MRHSHARGLNLKRRASGAWAHRSAVGSNYVDPKSIRLGASRAPTSLILIKLVPFASSVERRPSTLATPVGLNLLSTAVRRCSEAVGDCRGNTITQTLVDLDLREVETCLVPFA